MLGKKKPSQMDDVVADLVEQHAPAATHPTMLGFQAVAEAIGPAVFPTERFRKEAREAMLREFDRPRGESRADAGSLDGAEVTTSSVVRITTADATMTLADMEQISPEQAATASGVLERIVARHDARSHLS